MLSRMVTSFFGRNLLADGGVDVVAERGRLFDARAGAGAHVNLELAGVHRGEEVLAQPGRQHERPNLSRKQKQDQKDRRVVHAEGEQAQVTVAEALESRIQRPLWKRTKGLRLERFLRASASSCSLSRYLAMVGTSVRESR
jgi:hypothetical protein